jgi:hypothetical protein
VNVGTGFHVPGFAARVTPTVDAPVIVGVGAAVNADAALAGVEGSAVRMSAMRRTIATRAREESLSSTGIQSRM